MAVCIYCDQEMTDEQVRGCTLTHYSDIVGSPPLERLRFGTLAEGGHDLVRLDPGQRCHDCNCGTGELHHPGCDVEMCPKCKGQAAFCDCDLTQCRNCMGGHYPCCCDGATALDGEPCPECNGEGYTGDPGDRMRPPCAHCGGYGVLVSQE